MRIDIKDRDTPETVEPNNYHMLKCKNCNRTSKESKRFTRLCTSCRNTPSYRLAKLQSLHWDSWISKNEAV